MLYHIAKTWWLHCSPCYLRNIGHAPANVESSWINLNKLLLNSAVARLQHFSVSANFFAVLHQLKWQGSPFIIWIWLLQVDTFDIFIGCLTHSYQVHVIPFHEEYYKNIVIGVGITVCIMTRMAAMLFATRLAAGGVPSQTFCPDHAQSRPTNLSIAERGTHTMEWTWKKN